MCPTAWDSDTGHYNELTNPSAVDFFSSQLGASWDQVLGTLTRDTLAISGSAPSHPYNPFTGSNSNSVVYTELNSIGVTLPISVTNLSFLGMWEC
jgi:hypothetical protein